MDLGLEGKVVLITGGSGSIGRRLAERFVAEGACVVLTYNRGRDNAQRVVEEIEKRKGSALAIHYDLGNPESIKSAVNKVHQHFGALDILIANASSVPGTKVDPVPFEKIDPNEWRTAMRSDVEGTFSTVHTVLPFMKENGWGRIVVISANIVRRGGAGEEAFVASKMALHGLSRSVATGTANHGVLSNVVAPGPTVSRGLLARFPREIQEEFSTKSPEEIKKSLNKGALAGHFSTADDISGIVLYLASDANGNITGNEIHVAGGH